MSGTWEIMIKHPDGCSSCRYSKVQPIMQDDILEFVVERGNYIERVDCKKHKVTVSYQPETEKGRAIP